MRSPSLKGAVNRRTRLNSGGGRTEQFADLAGEKAAECAAILCCLPCGFVSLLFFLVVGIPAALFRRSLRRGRNKVESKVVRFKSVRRRWLKRKSSALVPAPEVVLDYAISDDETNPKSAAVDDDTAWQQRERGSRISWPGWSPPSARALRLESEIRAQLPYVGFGRSLSQKR